MKIDNAENWSESSGKLVENGFLLVCFAVANKHQITITIKRVYIVKNYQGKLPGEN